MPTLEGTIERIVFRNEQTHYAVVRLRTDDSGRLFRDDLTTLVGTLPNVGVGEVIEVTGEWETHPQHGRHLRVSGFKSHAPVSAEGLRRYLGSGIIKGVGPKTAERIVERFGEQTLEILDLEPDRLTEVKGVSASKRESIVRGWAQQKDIREIMMFLQEHGVSAGLGTRIYHQYGDQSLNVIRENPYKLEQDVHGVGFKTADELAQKLGLPHDSLPRLMTGIKHALSEAAADGHCYLPRAELLVRAAALLGVPLELLPPALEALSASREAFVEPEPTGDASAAGAVSTSDDAAIYLGAFFHAEHGTARRLRLLLNTSTDLPRVSDAEWQAVFATLAREHHIALAERQRAAVRLAYQSKVCILTGGPGTGKTTTVRALLDVLDHQGVDYALAAPTGRAAKRLAEASGRPARTLHRLLEYVPGNNSFAYNEQRPLPQRFVVLDEISMLDIFLAYNLLKALAPTTHLLLVGDADQLPSVGPGSVLRDLLASEVVPHVRLTELFRQAQASNIVVNAHKVNNGEPIDLHNTADGDFFFLRAEDPTQAQRLVVDLVARRLPTKYHFDPIRDIQVLAPMYRGAAGVQALNEALQAHLNPLVEPPPGGVARPIGPGDKVMQVRNNYDKAVYNGDVGQVVSHDRETGVLHVEFPEETGMVSVAYEAHELDELTLAYCISIHRAQGSEYACVVLPLVSQHYMMLQRNLLYTAMTRARRLCVVVGDARALRRAVENHAVAARNTGLAARLRPPAPRKLRAPESTEHATNGATAQRARPLRSAGD